MNHAFKREKQVIGERLRLAIINSNITYEGLADKLDLSTPRVIYEWINGNKLPSVKHFIMLKSILDVSLDKILAL